MSESIVEAETIVFGSCAETHVYINRNDEITIKQVLPGCEDDPFIVIPTHYVEKFIAALRKAKRGALEI